MTTNDINPKKKKKSKVKIVIICIAVFVALLLFIPNLVATIIVMIQDNATYLYDLSNDKTYYTLTLNNLKNLDGEETVTLPSTHFGKPIYAVKSNNFTSANISNLVIPEGVKYINSLSGFYGYESISLPNSLERIKNIDTSSIKGTLYEDAYYIGNDTNPHLVLFDAESDITKCVLHEETKFILSDTFKDCTSLNDIILSSNIVQISKGALDSDSLKLNYNLYGGRCYLGNDTNPYLAYIKDDNPFDDDYHYNTKIFYGDIRISYSIEEETQNDTFLLPDSTVSINGISGRSTKIRIPDGVEYLDCDNIYDKNIIIPKSVKVIDCYISFDDDYEGEKTVYYMGTEEEWKKIEKYYHNEDLNVSFNYSE